MRWPVASDGFISLLKNSCKTKNKDCTTKHIFRMGNRTLEGDIVTCLGGLPFGKTNKQLTCPCDQFITKKNNGYDLYYLVHMPCQVLTKYIINQLKIYRLLSMLSPLGVLFSIYFIWNNVIRNSHKTCLIHNIGHVGFITGETRT